MTSLTILGVLAVMAIAAAILLCYLKSPGKTPAVLVSTLNYTLLAGIIVVKSCTFNYGENTTKNIYVKMQRKSRLNKPP